MAVKVDTLKFSIRDSKHDTLYKTLRPLAIGLIKRQIKKAVSDAITTGMEYVDGQLIAVRNRMREESNKEGGSRTQALSELFKHKDKDDATTTADSVRSSKTHSQFKVVAKRDSALMPQTGHPTGWANRVQDKAEAAKHGQDWRSDA